MTIAVRTVALLALVACVDTPPLHEPEIESSHVEIKEIPAGRLPKLDVLVVLDDSAAMLPYEERVATLAPLVAQRLGYFTRNWVDLQIAVTGNAGRFRYLPGTETSVLTEAWQLDYTRRASFAGPLADALAALILADPATDQPSQPLEAMRLALERNALFVRDDAAFAVVLVSARDDASPLPVSEYVRWMDGFAGDLSGWARKPIVVVGIHPRPAPRLDEYYAALGPSIPVTLAAIDDDYAEAVAHIEPRIRTTLGLACLEDETIGQHSECTMHVYLGDTLRSVPECRAATFAVDRGSEETAPSAPEPPCWELMEEKQCWSGLTYRFRGYNYLSHPAFRLECRTR